MLTQDQLAAIEARLHDKMLAKLNMRWKTSGAYIPPGGSRVHVAAPLNDEDDRDFNIYLTAYRDAIEDFMGMLNPEQAQLDRLTAAMPPHMVRMVDWQPDMARGDGRRRRKSAKTGGARPARRDSAAARAGLRRLFEGGGDE